MEEAPKKEMQSDLAEEASVELPAPPGGKKKIISLSRLAIGIVATTAMLGETLTREPATWARIRAEKGLRARQVLNPSRRCNLDLKHGSHSALGDFRDLLRLGDSYRD